VKARLVKERMIKNSVAMRKEEEAIAAVVNFQERGWVVFVWVDLKVSRRKKFEGEVFQSLLCLIIYYFVGPQNVRILTSKAGVRVSCNVITLA